jgi:large conductance mechanosensitive channel
MPAINIVVPADTGYTDWNITINGSKILYGKFIGDVVSFLVVALALFIMIRKFLGWVLSLHRHEAAKEETPPLSRDQELLAEIRDLLKQSRPPLAG